MIGSKIVVVHGIASDWRYPVYFAFIGSGYQCTERVDLDCRFPTVSVLDKLFPLECIAQGMELLTRRWMFPIPSVPTALTPNPKVPNPPTTFAPLIHARV